MHFRLHNLDGRRGDAVQLGDALHHLDLLLLLQLGHHARRLVRVHIGEDQGDGLGPFAPQGGEQGLDVRLVHEGEFPVFQALGDLAQELRRRLLAIGLLQDGPGVFQAALGDSLVGQAQLVELVENVLRLLGAQHAQAGHLQGELLDLLVLHVLIDERRLLGSQGDDDRRRLLGGGQLHLLCRLGGGRHCRLSHCRRPLSAKP